MLVWGLILLLLASPALPQRKEEPRLPGGKSRKVAILQHDFERSKKDIAEIIKLAQQLQEEIEQNEEFVVDVRSIRKAEKIEKLSKSIKNRMKRLQ